MKRVDLLLLLVCGLFHLNALERYPRFWSDESIYAEAGHFLAYEGVGRNPSMGRTEGLDRRNVTFGNLHLLAVGLPDRLMGPSPAAVRLHALAAGLALVAGLAWLGRLMGHERAGRTAAAWLALSPDFYLYAHQARPEMMLAAFGIWGLALTARATALGRPRALFWAGLAIGSAFEVHLNAVLFAVAVGAVAVYAFGRRSLWLAAGMAPGVAVWLILHVGIDPEFFSRQWSQFWAPINAQSPFPFGSWIERAAMDWGELADYFWSGTGHHKMPLALLLAAGLLWGWTRRREPLDRLLGVFSAALLAAFLLIITAKAIYVFLLIPAALLLVARAVESAPRFRTAAVAGLAAYLAGATAVNHLKYIRNGHDGESYQAYVRDVRAALPEGEPVLGQALLSYAMTDRPFYSSWLLWWKVSEDGRHRYGPDLETLLERAGIRVLILDEVLEREFQIRAPERWREILKGYDEVARVESVHYGGFHGGPAPEGPRLTRILRRR